MIASFLNRIEMREWRGNLEGRATFWSRPLLEFRGWRVSLHRMVAADDPGCFHTHPARALRIVLSGGYVEQMEDGSLRRWPAGRIGVVRPELSHRIDRLMNGHVSYSLWVRAPKSAPIHLRGPGWAA